MAWFKLMGKETELRRGKGESSVEKEWISEGEEGRDGWLVGKREGEAISFYPLSRLISSPQTKPFLPF